MSTNLRDRCCPVILYDALEHLQNTPNLEALEGLKRSLDDILKGDFHISYEHEKLTEALLKFEKDSNINCNWEDLMTFLHNGPKHFSEDLQTSAYLYSYSECIKAFSNLWPNVKKHAYWHEAYIRAFVINGTNNDIPAKRTKPWSGMRSSLQVHAFSIAMCTFVVRMIGIACSHEGLIDWSTDYEKKRKGELNKIMMDNCFSKPTLKEHPQIRAIRLRRASKVAFFVFFCLAFSFAVTYFGWGGFGKPRR
ncbi:hypothetical protein GGI35DRAFT_453295 [Trichoderma velutinum]